MRVNRISRTDFVSNWNKIAKLIAGRRDEFFALEDVHSTQKSELLQNLASTQEHQNLVSQYRIDTKLDQIIYSDEIINLDIQSLLSDFSLINQTRDLAYVIKSDSTKFWATLCLFLWKFKSLKCYDRALTKNLRIISTGVAEITSFGAEYRESILQIEQILTPKIGNDWEIIVCIKQGTIPDNTSLPRPLSKHFKLTNYRKLPHDRFWADSSDNLLFASSIGISIIDESIVYFPVSELIQNDRRKLIGF